MSFPADLGFADTYISTFGVPGDTPYPWVLDQPGIAGGGAVLLVASTREFGGFNFPAFTVAQWSLPDGSDAVVIPDTGYTLFGPPGFSTTIDVGIQVWYFADGYPFGTINGLLLNAGSSMARTACVRLMSFDYFQSHGGVGLEGVNTVDDPTLKSPETSMPPQSVAYVSLASSQIIETSAASPNWFFLSQTAPTSGFTIEGTDGLAEVLPPQWAALPPGSEIPFTGASWWVSTLFIPPPEPPAPAAAEAFQYQHRWPAIYQKLVDRDPVALDLLEQRDIALETFLASKPGCALEGFEYSSRWAELWDPDDIAGSGQRLDQRDIELETLTTEAQEVEVPCQFEYQHRWPALIDRFHTDPATIVDLLEQRDIELEEALLRCRCDDDGGGGV